MAKQVAQGLVLKIIRNLLLAFIIFSIGFAIGKEFALRGVQSDLTSLTGRDKKIVVYYLRSTFRCWQCNMIEIYTDKLIRIEFAEYLEDRRLDWRVVDYLQDSQLANRYNISGNTIIVARFEDGVEVSHTRLDQVMEKVLNQYEFMNYLRNAIKEQFEDKK
ncbi:MAG: hypothetical protein K0B81_00800 [Candidatus Cloacimonetes bacterium]|nr:hypothetical protein [Candidatus Cloacimonadota bacterium]